MSDGGDSGLNQKLPDTQMMACGMGKDVTHCTSCLTQLQSFAPASYAEKQARQKKCNAAMMFMDGTSTRMILQKNQNTYFA